VGLYWGERQKKYFFKNSVDLDGSCGRTRSPCGDLVANFNNGSYEN